MDLVRWGIIGAGDIVRKRVARAIVDLQNCEFAAVAREQSDLAESFAKEFGAKRWYSDWREMLSDDDIDAIYVATPVFLHAEQTIAAAEAGKHVLCEKPMALNVDECDRMIAACGSNGVKLGIAYYRRFYPVLARVRDLLASGEIGHPTLAQINAFEYVELDGDDPRGWFVNKAKSGGGPMMDFGCHRIEVLTDLFGGVNSIQRMMANTFFDREVEDTAVALLEFDSQTIGSVSVTHAAREPQDTLDIYGTKGSIHIPVLNKGDITIRIAEGVRVESHPPHANIHQPLVADFADAVLSDSEPRVGGATGRLVAMIEDKIYGRA
jgi:predicted dehydrogenase